MSTRRTWARLWGAMRAADLKPGLEARMADPLWLLSRQWQFGEFQGDDAASPARVNVTHEAVPVVQLANGARKPVADIGTDDLIEPMVEAGDATNGPAAWRMSAEAGLQFLRMLPEAGRKPALDGLRQIFALPAPPVSSDPRGDAILRGLARGSFNGRALFEQTATPAKRRTLLDKLALGDHDALLEQWRDYYAGRFVAAPAEPLWESFRQEYQFGLTALSPDERTRQTLVATGGYAGGKMGWHSVDIDPKQSRAEKGGLPGRRHETLIPTPVRYSGMPAERFWDFEDGEVFFGGLSLEETDLSQLILTEFATVYSNDWFVLPVPAQTGTLSRIAEITVLDVFGDTVVVKSCAQTDGAKRVWRFFELSGDTIAAKPDDPAGPGPWLYLPRAVLGGEGARPVERVMLTRDEMANLAWGIETRVEGPAGEAIARDKIWSQVRDEFRSYLSKQDGAPRDTDAPWIYKLLSTAPPHWVPFIPETGENGPTGALVRGRMREWDLLGEARDALAGAQGQLLAPEAPLAIADEEVLRGGLTLTRHYQSARSPGGRLLVWVSRKKGPAGGDASSGRVTDQMERGGEG